jgi:hypothetical protein
VSDKPDFEALKRQRDTNLRQVVEAIAENNGWPVEEIMVHMHGGNGCYCACPDGPCEHEFQGWREFEDGNGGERVCKLCGLGAMMHDIRCGP